MVLGRIGGTGGGGSLHRIRTEAVERAVRAAWDASETLNNSTFTPAQLIQIEYNAGLQQTKAEYDSEVIKVAPALAPVFTASWNATFPTFNLASVDNLTPDETQFIAEVAAVGGLYGYLRWRGIL